MVGEGTLLVKDTKGSEILNKEITIASGINLYHISELKLMGGVYYVSIISNYITTEVIKQIIR